MARSKKRKKRKNQEEEETTGFKLNPEAKRGITIVLFFALAAIIILSFFGIAGSVGSIIDGSLLLFFGWDRFVFPIALILLGISMLFPEKTKITGWSYLGVFFFFLSFNALLNLIISNPSSSTLTGGIIGQFLALLLPSFIGFWGAVILTFALFFVSLILIFNTSLGNILRIHERIGNLFGVKTKNKFDEFEEESEEDGGWEEPEENLDEDQQTDETLAEPEDVEETIDEQPQEEKILTTKKRRRVAIPLKLLDYHAGKPNSGDIERNKEIIEKTFRQFGIDVEMGQTTTGPTVTQFTLRPAQGVKISRIMSLQNDVALALAAHPIRIEAPIPGKSLVGIEVPNQKVAKVSLRELLESKTFKRSESNLSFPVGVDVSGKPIVASVDKMPHILVAGATGSGKSVCLNTIIVSLLYQNGPDDLKLILIDPKRVELTAYTGIPHLLVPPIVKSDDAINALKWTVREMERRLEVLSKFGVRDINSYNRKVEDQMPKIVIAIDELADLMSTNGREMEGAVVRIAQMARAVGIHLVLATQRPSVDVITGLIKANFPARIAFAVASQTDSRTILDCAGAEKLLGRGDMLFSTAELSKPKRMQGPFASEEEVGRVVHFLRENGEPDYNYAVTETQKTGSVFDGSGDDDLLLEDAIRVVLEAGKASTSLLQRRIKVGYARAARIMDIMEEHGVIGPSEGAKPRDVLIEEWPPGGNIAQSIPTAQDDYNEAYGSSTRFKDEEEEMEENDKTIDDGSDDEMLYGEQEEQSIDNDTKQKDEEDTEETGDDNIEDAPEEEEEEIEDGEEEEESENGAKDHW
ncbi:MAG: DNA translocase FtsK 4TM domain-containing protein [Patescibacteria group bacterium]